MEEKEFRQKVMPLRRLMFSMALRLGMPPDDASDVVQETQLKLWRCRENIPPEVSACKAYCMRAVRNEAITFLRRCKDAEPLEAAPDLRANEDPYSVEHRDTQSRIETLIDSLPEGQRRVIRLSSFGGFEITEIVEATGFTPGNVRQLLSRGRKRLRELLDKDLGI